MGGRGRGGHDTGTITRVQECLAHAHNNKQFGLGRPNRGEAHASSFNQLLSAGAVLGENDVKNKGDKRSLVIMGALGSINACKLHALRVTVQALYI